MSSLNTVSTKSLDIENLDFRNHFLLNSPPLFKNLMINPAHANICSRFLAFLLLIILSPLFAVIFLAILVSMPGPILYSQVRVGRDGAEFWIYKFRTMVVDAELRTGAILAEEDDARITSLGKFLRESHLDELPQLYNVLVGDMVFIGPRPERPCFVKEFDKAIVDYQRRKEVFPGITGLAQICLPYSASASDKIKYDTFYIDNQSSIILNLMICYHTVLKIFGHCTIGQQ